MKSNIALGRLLTGVLVLAVSLGAGVASAQSPLETTTTTGETTTTDPAEPESEALPEPPPDDGSATTGEEPEQQAATAGRPRLTLEQTSPSRIYWRSTEKAKFRYEFAGGGGGRRDLVVKLYKRGDDKPRKRWHRADRAPNTTYVVKWGGSPGVSGTYKFRVSLEGGKRLDRTNAKGDPSFRSYTHKFPVRGGHSYGDGYGAGRGHRGQDIFANCGTALVAARAGKVQWKAYQGSGAGYYVVIDGKRTNKDYVYMHLRGPANVREGESVRTGKLIGEVGESGNASGCHLHFELWKGNWYGGGHPMRSVTRHMKKWDRWS